MPEALFEVIPEKRREFKESIAGLCTTCLITKSNSLFIKKTLHQTESSTVLRMAEYNHAQNTDNKKPLIKSAAQRPFGSPQQFFVPFPARWWCSGCACLSPRLSSYYRSYPLSSCSARSRPLVSFSTSMRNPNIASTSFNRINVTIPV